MKTWKKPARRRRRIRHRRKWGRYLKSEIRAFDRATRREQTALATVIGKLPGRNTFRDRETGDLYGGEGPFPPVYAEVVGVSLKTMLAAAHEVGRLALVGDKGPEVIIPTHKGGEP